MIDKSVILKIFAAILVLGLVAFGGYEGGKIVEQTKAQKQIDAMNASVATARVDAETKGRQEQQVADQAQIDTLKKNAADNAAAVAAASKAAGEASQKAQSLTDQLARLRHEDASVDTWAGTCLPAGLRSSLHAGSKESPDGRCK